MTRNGWRQGLGDLARDLVRLLAVYALVLQMLAPLAVAQAEASDGIEGHSVLCSALASLDAVQPAKVPTRIVHDCLSCCLGSAVAILAVSTDLPAPARFPLPVASATLKTLVLPARAGSPPPQRAPPGNA